MSKDGLVVLLVGPSGVGKTSIENELHRSIGTEYVPIITSRERRENDIHYIYKSTKEIHDDEDIYMYAKLSEDWLYGVSLSGLKSNEVQTLSIITVKAGDRIQRLLSKLDVKFITVYINTSKTIRLERMVARGESVESIEARFDFEDRDVIYSVLEPDICMHNYDYNRDSDITFKIEKLIKEKRWVQLKKTL